MKTIKTTVLTILTALSLNAFGGADHDHGAPSFQPPKGGVLKSTGSKHFELVKSDKKVSIYAYNKEGKSISTQGLILTAELEIPRKKTTAQTLENKNTHWEAVIDGQSSHRYTLKVSIVDGNEKDYVKFTVENK